MTLPEAHAIVLDHQKWRRAEPPYNWDPDEDEMYPLAPKTTPKELGQALDLLLAATAPDSVPSVPPLVPSV